MIQKLRYHIDYKIFKSIFLLRILLLSNFRSIYALLNGIKKANNYKAWDGWSLSHKSIYYIAWIILKYRKKNIIEFGSGYSTIVFSEFFKSLSWNIRFSTYDHNLEYLEKVKSNVNNNVEFNLCELKQLSDREFEECFVVDKANIYFNENGTFLDKNEYFNTRIKNVFYNNCTINHLNNSIDFMILDGPNGNGRSLAYSIFKNKVTENCHILLDDFLDYDFERYMNKTFKQTKIIKKSIDNYLNKEYAVYIIIKK